MIDKISRWDNIVLPQDNFERDFNDSKIIVTSNTNKLKQITICLNEFDSFNEKTDNEVDRIAVAVKLSNACFFRILLYRVAMIPPNNSKKRKSPAKNMST